MGFSSKVYFYNR